MRSVTRPNLARARKKVWRGDASVLNVYFSKPSSSEGELLGYATFSYSYVTNRHADGVVLRDTTIAGGSNAVYNEGVSHSKEDK
jgi:hypothetical protein